MWPKTHVVYGFIASLALYLIFPSIGLLEASLIFFSSFLIDIDHYFYYVGKTKDISLINAINWFSERKRKWHKLSALQIRQYTKKFKHHFLIFHGFEFVALLAILTFYFPLIFWILIGVTIHLLMDYRELVSLGLSPLIKMSQTYVYITNKKKKDF